MKAGDFVVLLCCLGALHLDVRADAIIICENEEIRVTVGTADREGYLASEDEREVGHGREVRIRSRDIANLTPGGKPGGKIIIYATNVIPNNYGDDNGQHDGSQMIRDGEKYRYNRLDRNGKPSGRSLPAPNQRERRAMCE
jgi:hypothetical protein